MCTTNIRPVRRRPSGHVTKMALRAIAVTVTLLASAGCTKSDTNSAATTTEVTTTTVETGITVLGCSVEPADVLETSRMTDPICTAGEVITRYCGIDDDDLTVPAAQTYMTTEGSVNWYALPGYGPGASVTITSLDRTVPGYTPATPTPGDLVIKLSCPDKNLTFTRREWLLLLGPASNVDEDIESFGQGLVDPADPTAPEINRAMETFDKLVSEHCVRSPGNPPFPTARNAFLSAGGEGAVVEDSNGNRLYLIYADQTISDPGSESGIPTEYTFGCEPEVFLDQRGD